MKNHTPNFIITLLLTAIINFSHLDWAVIPPSDITGTYKIDLRPTPSSAPYYQYFIITDVDQKKLKGTFYGSEIEDGLINWNWDNVYFAFVTRDNSTTYYHLGRIEAGKVYGITYAPNRLMTAPWTGEKITEE